MVPIYNGRTVVYIPEKEDAVMSSLLELVAQANEIERQILENNGELTPELEGLFDFAEGALVEKASQYEFTLKRLKEASSSWKKEADRYAKVSKSLERIEKSIRDRMKIALLELGRREISGKNTRIVLTETAPKLVIDGDVPSNYQIQVTELVPDKERIKEHLESGIEIPGARLEGGYALRFYANTKEKK